MSVQVAEPLSRVGVTARLWKKGIKVIPHGIGAHFPGSPADAACFHSPTIHLHAERSSPNPVVGLRSGHTSP